MTQILQNLLNRLQHKSAVNIYLGNTPKSKTALYDSWTPDHHNATAPIQENSINFSNSEVVNSYGLENGSYFRNKTMILGLQFSKELAAKNKNGKIQDIYSGS